MKALARDVCSHCLPCLFVRFQGEDRLSLIPSSEPIDHSSIGEITQFEQGEVERDEKSHSHIPTNVGNDVGVGKTKRLQCGYF